MYGEYQKMIGLNYVREEREEALRTGTLTLLPELAVNPLIRDRTSVLISTAKKIRVSQTFTLLIY